MAYKVLQFLTAKGEFGGIYTELVQCGLFYNNRNCLEIDIDRQLPVCKFIFTTIYTTPYGRSDDLVNIVV